MWIDKAFMARQPVLKDTENSDIKKTNLHCNVCHVSLDSTIPQITASMTARGQVLLGRPGLHNSVFSFLKVNNPLDKT